MGGERKLKRLAERLGIDPNRVRKAGRAYRIDVRCSDRVVEEAWEREVDDLFSA
jgi:hypothetical protein